jgi:hypothetical protein
MDDIRKVIATLLEEAELADSSSNVSIFADAIARWGDLLVPVGIEVICQRLREIASSTMNSAFLFSGVMERMGDQIIVNTGAKFIDVFADAVVATGPKGYERLLFLLEGKDEDISAIAALLLAYPPLVREKSITPLKKAYSKAFGTGLRIAIAFALLAQGDFGPIKELAPRFLGRKDSIEALRVFMMKQNPHASSNNIEERLYGIVSTPSAIQIVCFDIATDGQAPRHTFPDWKRKSR